MFCFFPSKYWYVCHFDFFQVYESTKMVSGFENHLIKSLRYLNKLIELLKNCWCKKPVTDLWFGKIISFVLLRKQTHGNMCFLFLLVV